jgi:hypothetical protein
VDQHVDLSWLQVFPRKPHPMENEYHTLCCGLSGIMYAIELVEGQDRPRQLQPAKYSYKHGKTTGLLLRLTDSIAHSGKVVIMDSGFCVLKALINSLHWLVCLLQLSSRNVASGLSTLTEM